MSMYLSADLRERLALNPTCYLELPFSTQCQEEVALECIKNGIRSTRVIDAIMTCCPSLRSNKQAWSQLLQPTNGAVIESHLLINADTNTITNDAVLMKSAIEQCGPRAFEFVAVQDKKLLKELALLTLQGLANDRIFFEHVKNKFAHEVELVVKEVFNRVPELSDSVDAWVLVVETFVNHVLCDYYDISIENVWALASPDIRDNTDIMKRMCLESSGDHLEYASERLRRDTCLIREIIQSQRDENDFLLQIPSDVLVDNPSLIIEFLEYDGNTGTLLDALPVGLWKNRTIVELYLRKGGQPHDAMEDDAGRDWSYCLAFVEGAALGRRRALTSWICDELQDDRAFLLEAAKRNKWILRYVNDELKQSPFDLLLVTAAYHGIQPIRTFQMMSHERAGTVGYMPIDVLQFAVIVNELLCIHESFRIFLCGIHIDRPAECLLTMLNLGSDCLIVEIIADFLGVPYGERLRHLRLSLPIADELCRDPEGRDFLATMGREYYLAETSYNVI